MAEKIPAAKALDMIYNRYASLATVFQFTSHFTVVLSMQLDECEHTLFSGSFNGMIVYGWNSATIREVPFCTARYQCSVWDEDLNKIIRDIDGQIRLCKSLTKKHNLHKFKKAGGLL